MEKHRMHPDDAAFLEETTNAARDLYASLGSLFPSVLIKTAPGVMPNSSADMLVLSIPGLGGSATAKANAVETILHHSLRLGSPRSAVIAESWTVEMGPDTEKELIELRRRGKGIEAHPDAVEIVMIFMESEHGRTSASLRINRLHRDMTELVPTEDVVFTPWTEDDGRPMLLKGFHMRMAERIRPDVMAWARGMDGMYGDPRKREADGQQVDHHALPLTH